MHPTVHCPNPVPDNCAFCLVCGEKNPDFDRESYKEMHPFAREYGDQMMLEDCLNNHAALQATYEALKDDPDCARNKHCSDCGVRVIP